MKIDFERWNAPVVPEERSKSDILNSMLEKVQRMDFVSIAYPRVKELREKAQSENDLERETAKKELARMKLTERQKYVIIINELIRIAEENNWGMAKNGVFVYLYNGAYWEVLDEDVLGKFLSQVAERMGIVWFDAQQFQVRDYLLRQFMCSSFITMPEGDDNVKINLKNGTFVFGDERGLREPRREDFIKYQLPFSYDPSAKCPIFDKYLREVLPDQTVRDVLAEFVAYTFTKNLKLEKALVLYGDGSNGKGVFFEVVCALLGRENVSTYDIKNLTDESGYFRSMIANKLVNFSPEIGTDYEGDTFKRLCSGESLGARLPHGKPFEISSYAKIIFNANRLPVPKEITHAFFRRFLILPFNVTIEGDRVDPDLPKKIINNELAGVFNWVLDGLERILKNRRFTSCKTIDQELEKYKRESDSVCTFIDDEGWNRSIDDRVELKVIFGDYRQYCFDNGLRPCGSREFSKRLDRQGIEVKKSNGYRYAYAHKNNKEIF